MLILLTAPAFSQSPIKTIDKLTDDLRTFSENNRGTSIYLQTNKGIYETGEDLWFKAYSLDAKYLEPSVLDSTLYVQLSNAATDSIAWQEKYKIINGFSDGHIFLDGSLDEGEYFLKAYTKNSFCSESEEFYTSRKVAIVGSINSETEDNTLRKSLRGIINDIQFDLLPEGGYLIDGIKSKVAFKAIDKKGNPLNVSGTLYENDRSLLEFSTIYGGMGSFDLLPDASKKYSVKLHLPNDNSIIDYNFPNIKNKGIALRLKLRDDKKIVFKISGNIGKERVYLRAQIRGIFQTIATGILEDSLSITMPLIDFPQGISEVTLLDKNLKPVAERLFYVNPEKKLYITAKLSKNTYKTKEKVILEIRTNDEDGSPVQAHLGVSVYDRIFKNPMDDKDIATHYHLSTQLKGSIYNPSYYFHSANKNKEEALDLLMLTQGWRRYLWNVTDQRKQKAGTLITEGIHGSMTIIKKKKNAPEQHVVLVLDPTNKEDKRLVLLNGAKDFYLGTQYLKMGRSFYIRHFGTKDHKIILNARDGFDDLSSLNIGLQINYPIPNIEKEIKKTASPFKIQGGINLEEVSVTSKKSKVFRDKYLGHLDSLIKLDINTDYVGGPCGTLNCQVHEFHPENYKPVEGKTYSKMMGFKWNNDRTAYTITGHQTAKYTYPQFTEKELLEKFNLIKVQGYYGKKEFYRPNYEECEPFPDYRNTLIWASDVVTDKNGNATLEFFTSDINTYFEGIIEGVGLKGLLGKKEFSFFVTQEKK